MGLLDQIKKKTKPKHPLEDLSLEIKINYLQAVAFFIAINEVIDNTEREKYEDLIFALACDDMKEDLVEYLENPNAEDLKNIFKFIRDNNFSIIYLLEIFFLVSDTKLNDLKKEFLNIISDILQYNRHDIFDIFCYANTIKNDSKIQLKYFHNILNNNILFQYKDEYGNDNCYYDNEFINFYKINGLVKEELHNEIENYKCEYRIKNHPLLNARIKIKMLYLQSLAYSIEQKTQLTYKEKEVFFKIVKSLNLTSEEDTLDAILRNTRYEYEDLFESSIDIMIDENFMEIITDDCQCIIEFNIDEISRSMITAIWISTMYFKKKQEEIV